MHMRTVLQSVYSNLASLQAEVADMAALSTSRLVIRRIRHSRMLLASVFLGILFAATLAAAAPVYLVSLERLALNIEIDRLGRFQSKRLAFAYYVPATPQQAEATEGAFVETVGEHIGEIYAGHRRLVTGMEFYAMCSPTVSTNASSVASACRGVAGT